MKISIIIVNWNTRDMLLRCLGSIIDDIYFHKNEIIVVDNASSDGSVEAVRDSFPVVKIIQNERNLGFAKANNIGIKYCTGQYVCLVNSDIKVIPGCFDKLIEYMDLNHTVGALGPKLLNSDLTLQMSCKHFPTLWNNFSLTLGLNKLFRQSKFFCGEHMEYFPHNTTRNVDALVGAFLMVRQEAISKVGLLDEDFFMYGEETDWCKRFWKAGYSVVFYPKAEVIHYGAGSSSLEPVRFYKELYNSKIKYWGKHYSNISLIGFKALIILRQVLRLIVSIIELIIAPQKRADIKSRIKSHIEVVRSVFNKKKPMYND